MQATALGESGRRGLEHEPHRRAYAPQPGRVLSRHDTGVEMWEEVCLREHRLSGPTEILECRLASERVELFSGSSVTQLGLVAEGEQRLAAANRCAGASDAVALVTQRSRFRTELVERPGKQLHQRSLDPRPPATEAQKSIEATPSAVAT